jgi:hypothetical protein
MVLNQAITDFLNIKNLDEYNEFNNILIDWKSSYLSEIYNISNKHAKLLIDHISFDLYDNIIEEASRFNLDKSLYIIDDNKINENINIKNLFVSIDILSKYVSSREMNLMLVEKLGYQLNGCTYLIILYSFTTCVSYTTKIFQYEQGICILLFYLLLLYYY